MAVSWGSKLEKPSPCAGAHVSEEEKGPQEVFTVNVYGELGCDRNSLRSCYKIRRNMRSQGPACSLQPALCVLLLTL